MKSRSFGKIPFLGLVLLLGIGWFVWSKRSPRFLVPTESQISEFFPPQSRSVLEDGGQWRLYALDPENWVNGPGSFHGYGIVGEASLDDPQQLFLAKQALYGAIGNSEDRAACFSPRHGFRITRGKKTVDIVLCFECGTAYIYDGDRHHEAGVNPDAQSSKLALDQILEQHGVIPVVN